MTSHEHAHDHTHGVINSTILTTGSGIWAVKWSFIGLMITTAFQAVIVYFSGSIALLADTIHNLGDACTAIPLGVAFLFARKKPTKRFTYGYGRVEDLAGVFVVLTILFSALVAGYESINRFFHPREIEYLWAVAMASLIGFLGNEAVAIFRVKVGKEINSAALVADGYHARVDGFVSLGVLLSVTGVWLGYPLADPIIGFLMTLMIFKIVWKSSKAVFTRLLDGVEPDIVNKIKNASKCNEIILGIDDVKTRWLGHHLYAELVITVDLKTPIEKVFESIEELKHGLFHSLPILSHVTVSLKDHAEEHDNSHDHADH